MAEEKKTAPYSKSLSSLDRLLSDICRPQVNLIDLIETTKNKRTLELTFIAISPKILKNFLKC